jgi:hypothetical protein
MALFWHFLIFLSLNQLFMHRRNFLKTGSVAGLSLTAVAAGTSTLLANPKMRQRQ